MEGTDDGVKRGGRTGARKVKGGESFRRDGR